jgi:dTMP kinase
MTEKSRLIVIEGIDGSGKETQAKLLVERLIKESHAVEMTDFPRHGEPSAALVDDYLNNKFGKATEVHPCFASMLYAKDRHSMKQDMDKWLSEGKIIVSNRYVSANYGHQGCKIKDKEKRLKFFKWLDELEYEWFGIPKPSINLFLYVPWNIAKELILTKRESTRDYINKGVKDAHEDDDEHLRLAVESYLDVVEERDDWHRIDCDKEGKIMSREEISELIWDVVKKKL